MDKDDDEINREQSLYLNGNFRETKERIKVKMGSKLLYNYTSLWVLGPTSVSDLGNEN